METPVPVRTLSYTTIGPRLAYGRGLFKGWTWMLYVATNTVKNPGSGETGPLLNASGAKKE